MINPQDELFEFCRLNRIAVLARVPFDEGSLTGNINENTTFPKDDWRNYYFRGERKKEVSIRVEKILEDVNSEAENIAEAALRYTVSFDAVTSVIPGMRSEKNLLANINSVERGPLSVEMIEKLKVHRWERNFYK